MMAKRTILFNVEEKRIINQALMDAEDQTGCEIVVVVADASGRYDRGEDIFGLVLSLLVLSALWLGLPLLQQAGGSSASWEAAAAPLGLISILTVIFISFAAGAWLATIFPALKMLFVARQEMEDEVSRAAQSSFFEYDLRKAKNGAGILIYISVFERMVQVLGDEAASAHLQDGDFQAICDEIRTGLKKGKAADGLVQAMAVISAKLNKDSLSK